MIGADGQHLGPVSPAIDAGTDFELVEGMDSAPSSPGLFQSN